jgi:hypothetical protein
MTTKWIVALVFNAIWLFLYIRMIIRSRQGSGNWYLAGIDVILTLIVHAGFWIVGLIFWVVWALITK